MNRVVQTMNRDEANIFIGHDEARDLMVDTVRKLLIANCLQSPPLVRQDAYSEIDTPMEDTQASPPSGNYGSEQEISTYTHHCQLCNTHTHYSSEDMLWEDPEDNCLDFECMKKRFVDKVKHKFCL